VYITATTTSTVTATATAITIAMTTCGLFPADTSH